MRPIEKPGLGKALATFARWGRSHGQTKAAQEFLTRARAVVKAARSALPSYSDHLERSHAAGEDNDCTVRAVAAAGGVDYETALAWSYKHGRKKGRGWWIKFDALHELGLKATAYRLNDGRRMGKTVRTFERRNRGNYIIYTYGHAVGIRDGKAIDYTAGGLHRVQWVWKIEPLDSPA
jgi:hypothetical protein